MITERDIDHFTSLLTQFSNMIRPPSLPAVAADSPECIKFYADLQKLKNEIVNYAETTKAKLNEQ